MLSTNLKYLICLFLISLSTTLLYSHPLLKEEKYPAGIDTPHYYSVLVLYKKHLEEYGFIPYWFPWWYAGYPEGLFISPILKLLVHFVYFSGISLFSLYQLTKIIFHSIFGLMAGYYAFLLFRSKLAGLLTIFFLLTSPWIINNLLVDRFASIIALPFLLLSLISLEFFLNTRRVFYFLLLTLVSGLTFILHGMIGYLLMLPLLIRLFIEYASSQDKSLPWFCFPLIFFMLNFTILPLFLRIFLLSKEKGGLEWLTMAFEFQDLYKHSFSVSYAVDVSWGLPFFGFLGFTIYSLIKNQWSKTGVFITLASLLFFVFSTGHSTIWWRFLPFHSNLDAHRFALLSVIFMSMASASLILAIFTLINSKIKQVTILLLIIFVTIALAMPYSQGFHPLSLSEGTVRVLVDIKTQNRILSSGFVHYAPLLFSYTSTFLLDGWFYQGCLVREYLDALLTFGAQEPPPQIKYQTSRNPLLFSNLLKFFNVEYLFLGYDWFDKEKITQTLDYKQFVESTFVDVRGHIDLLFKERVLGSVPLWDERTKRFEEFLVQSASFFSSTLLYGEINVYKHLMNDNAYSLLVVNPICFIGSKEKYRTLFYALHSFTTNLTVIVNCNELEYTPHNISTVILYGANSDLIGKSGNYRIIIIEEWENPTLNLTKAVVEYCFNVSLPLDNCPHHFRIRGLVPFPSEKEIKERITPESEIIAKVGSRPLVQIFPNNTIQINADLPLLMLLSHNIHFFHLFRSLLGEQEILYVTEFERISGDEFIVKSSLPGYVLIKEAYFPWWRTTGKEIYEAGPKLMLTWIEGGVKTSFVFSPPFFISDWFIMIWFVLSNITICLLFSRFPIFFNQHVA